MAFASSEIYVLSSYYLKAFSSGIIPNRTRLYSYGNFYDKAACARRNET